MKTAKSLLSTVFLHPLSTFRNVFKKRLKYDVMVGPTLRIQKMNL